MDQLSINEATRLILEYLEGMGTFSMTDSDIFPPQSGQKNKNIFGNFTGFELADSPREGKAHEYTGIALFSIRIENKSFYKCPIQVSIPGWMNEALIQDIEYYKEVHGHFDVGISGGELSVRTGKNDNLYLAYSGQSYELCPAWEVQFIDYIDRRATPVRRMEGSRFIRENGSREKRITSIFCGDTGVYDQHIDIPKKGDLQFNGANYPTLQALVPAMIGSPKFMRTFNEMTEEAFRHRVQLIEELILSEDFLDWRDDYDGLSPSQIDDAVLRLKIFQPKVQTAPPVVKHVAPPQLGFSFKVPPRTT